MIAIKEKLKYALAGALAGVVNGALGAGGGVLLVPILLKFMKLEEKRAFATSVFIILPISLVTAIVYLCCGKIDWALAAPYLIGGVAGGLLAGKKLKDMPVIWLRRIFGAVLVIGGIRAVLG